MSFSSGSEAVQTDTFAPAAPPPDPLVFDLDGTLIHNDLTHELLFLCLRWYPLLFPLALLKLLFSRAGGKRWLVEKVGDRIDPQHLPYNGLALELIEAHRTAGGRVELVSGSDHQLVLRIGDYLGLFDHVQGSVPPTNLVSRKKAASLAERHDGQFRYAGNSKQDIRVWQVSKGGYGFNAPSRAFRLKQADKTPIEVVKIYQAPSESLALIRAMRPHQWAKNLLIFMVPLLVISQMQVLDWVHVLAGFACLSLLASGTYIINDLFDIPDDRAHRTKRNRPLAAGLLSVPLAVFTSVLLIGGSLVASALLDPTFGLAALVYTLTTLAYSFRLKRIAILDVVVLSCLFAIRVVAGAILAEAPPSTWLMAFIGLFFLSLAIAKRYVEVSKTASAKPVPGRGYGGDDGPVLLGFGVATAIASVLAFLTYGLLAEERVLDNDGIILCVAGVLTAWLMRLWLLTTRGEMHDDPVLFAVKDKTSFLTVALLGGLVLFETSRPIWQSLF